MSSRKECSRCGETKPVEDFYALGSSGDGRMPYCKRCDNARPRKATAAKINRHRARHRAVADLIDMYQDEFIALLEIRLAEAREESEVLAETPQAKEHFGSEPVRLRPGRRMPGEKAGDRIDVARCPHCIKHHDRGHVCAECGKAPGETPPSSIQKLETRYSSSVPSGMRPRVTVDAAALAEFNAGTARAARGPR